MLALIRFDIREASIELSSGSPNFVSLIDDFTEEILLLCAQKKNEVFSILKFPLLWLKSLPNVSVDNITVYTVNEFGGFVVSMIFLGSTL